MITTETEVTAIGTEIEPETTIEWGIEGTEAEAGVEAEAGARIGAAGNEPETTTTITVSVETARLGARQRARDWRPPR